MDVEKYASYSVEDYLEDQDFRHWVALAELEENERWQAVFSHYPDQKVIADQARLLLLEMKQYFQPDDMANKPLNQIFIESLKLEVSHQQDAVIVKMQRRIFLKRLTLAASVVLLLGFFSWMWLGNWGQGMEKIATGYGEWKKFSLPDGSEVNLNAHSEISFASEWTPGSDRKVWLKGEAFFSVVKDSRRAKFTVFTDDLAVEVLGTSFNVLSRGDQTEVFLQEGKVRLEMGSEEQLLAPGEFISYSSPKKAITEFKKSSSELHIAWKDGALILKDKTVAEIFAKMEEIYGYEVNVNNPALLNVRKTIAIPMDRIELAIPILEKLLGVEIRLEDDQLMVR
ncbi:MAG: FecR domain-containing protein [Bacteroidia bacterium]